MPQMGNILTDLVIAQNFRTVNVPVQQKPSKILHTLHKTRVQIFEAKEGNFTLSGIRCSFVIQARQDK